MEPAGTIIAMGGGGFSMEPENPLLDEFILRASGKAEPRVCFVPTASGDSEAYVRNFYSAFRKLPCWPTHLPLWNPPSADLRGFVADKDVIYVGGGNTKGMLALWREWGLDAIFREAWAQGKVLAGISAGAICWFEQGLTDSIPGTLSPLACLGFLRGSACPHYDGESERRPAYSAAVASGALADGYAMEDGAAVVFSGTKLKEAVCSRPGARAFRLERQGAGARETPIPARYLG